MIPKSIWQTHKTPFPPNQAVKSIKTWLDKNPDYTWYYFDDERCRQFIYDHFDDEFYQMYQSFPYGVMKSDVWRIAIVYIYGGVYADIDTECIHPIDSWTTDKELVVSIEPPSEHSLVNFCFAAIPKHPALYNCLQRLVKHYNDPNYLDKEAPTGTPIQNFGQAAFNDAIAEYFISNPQDSKAKKYKLDDNAFTPALDNRTLVHHLTGSVFWTNYESWRHEQQRDFGY